MRIPFTFMCVLALGLMGCGQDLGPVGGSGGSGGSGGAGGGKERTQLTVYLVDWDPTAPGTGNVGPLPGVKVCEFNTTNCEVTDDTGFAFLQMPTEQEVMVTVEKDGYGSLLGSEVVSADGSAFTSFAPKTDVRLGEQYERVMSPYPMAEGTGAIALTINGLVEVNEPGATFELIGNGGKAYYRDANKDWSLDLTATSTDGVGGFVEVTPGEYQIRVGGTAENCVVWRGWLSDLPNTVRVPVREGLTSVLRMNCD